MSCSRTTQVHTEEDDASLAAEAAAGQAAPHAPGGARVIRDAGSDGGHHRVPHAVVVGLNRTRVATAGRRGARRADSREHEEVAQRVAVHLDR